jgi:Uma2 family endonuclease
VTSANVQGAPAIVVEILSPGTRRRDETLKRQLYARAGVREYWMVNPDRESIEVCRQAAPGVLDTAAELRARQGDLLTSPLLPGFSVALSRLFERRAD